jgi:hypothetical protein
MVVKPVRKRRRPARRSIKRAETSPRRTRLAASVEIQEIEAMRLELDRLAAAPPPRWNANPDDVRKSVLKLVLTLVDFIRQILERQAIRRMEANTLSAEQTEAVGMALQRLEETIRDLANQFGLDPEDLNLDLGPIGKLT